MNFELSENQKLLRDSLARYLAKEYPFAERKRILAAGSYDAKKWRAFAELGWLGAALPEEVGGLGGSPVDLLLIMEQFGRHLVLEPFVSSVVVGGTLLLHGARKGQNEDLLGPLIAGELHLALAAGEANADFAPERIAAKAVRQGGGCRLSGRKPIVPNAAIADKLIVAARTAGAADERKGITLFMVGRDAPGVSIRPFKTHDGHNAGEVTLADTPVSDGDVLGERDQGLALLERATDHGAAALCAEAVGSATYLIEATGTHLKTREQYGQPLARFQALQHRMADMYVACELSRSMAYFAAQALSQPEEARKRDLSAAKVQIARGTSLVGREAVQLHGGMGMSEDFNIAHHFKRITMIGLLYGDEAFHLKRFSDLSSNEEL